VDCVAAAPYADYDFNLAALHPAYPIKCQTSTQRTPAPDSADTGRASRFDPLESDIQAAGRIDSPYAMPSETNIPIHVLRSPRAPLSEIGPHLSTTRQRERVAILLHCFQRVLVNANGRLQRTAAIPATAPVFVAIRNGSSTSIRAVRCAQIPAIPERLDERQNRP
jgi:hypothetical protein